MKLKWATAAVHLVALVILVRPEKGAAMWFNLPAGETKCLSEQIYSGVLVLGEYFSFSGSDGSPAMTVQVKSPLGNILYEKDHANNNVTAGQFSFTTTAEAAGLYVICFRSYRTSVNSMVSLDWKIGIFAKDWDSIATTEKIEGLQLELRKLEEATKAIRQSTLNLMLKDVRMQRMSNKTNAKVARYSLISLGVCILISALQVWQLKRFFRHKKLL
ncbi:unnamed protein product [Cuscuta campestris]|uniref:GOLD domain-containing protein n=1 Tax=Cuscuta campestris TaxID=132261 RepID=A0A484K3I9_9ASTE|nr:unnamed protein product [Cuscuta campestris]